MKRLLAAIALLLAACSADKTQLVVLVDSDLEVPGELSRLDVYAGDDRDQLADETSFTLLGRTQPKLDGAYTLPLSFGVEPREGDPNLTVVIQVDGVMISGGRDVVRVSRRARLRMIAGKRLLLPMFLARSCEGRQCGAGETCTEDGCAAELVNPNDLRAIEPGDELLFRRDASAHDAAVHPDAASDGGAPSDDVPGPVDPDGGEAPDGVTPGPLDGDIPVVIPDTGGEDIGPTVGLDQGPAAGDGAADAGSTTPDAAALDAGTPAPDAAPDAGFRDATAPDAAPDATAPDAAPDAGFRDATAPDALPAADANPVDSGTTGTRDSGVLDASAPDSGVVAGCRVTVPADPVVFGAVEPGRAFTMPIAVRNEGSATCYVEGVRLRGGSAFVLEPTPARIPIAPGREHHLLVTLAPAGLGAQADRLDMRTADPMRPTITVNVTGVGSPISLRALPRHVDMGLAQTGCRARRATIYLQNTTSAPVALTSADLRPGTTSELTLLPITVTPTIQPGSTYALSVDYAPVDSGLDTGAIVVSYSGTGSPLIIALVGQGQASPSVTDVHVQAAPPRTDLLMIVDNSASMSEEQGALATLASTLLGYPQSLGIDYQIGVTSTDVTTQGDQGRLVARGTTMQRIIRPTSPDPAAAFRDNVMLGTQGSATEAGLHAAYLALSDPNLTGTNAGFLRRDAALSVVVLSDEDDQSTWPWDFYSRFLDDIRGWRSPAQVSLHAVVGPLGGCSGPTGGAAEGRDYLNASFALFGISRPICTSNSAQLWAEISAAAFGPRRAFGLSGTPILNNAGSPVTVRVDNNLVPVMAANGQTNWSVNSTPRALRFLEDAAVPAIGQTVEISYTLSCAP